MLNKKALEAALAAYTQAETETFITGQPFVEAIIKAFVAALPDEDGLVRTLRDQATIADERRRGGMAVLLRKAADALEAARVKLAAAPEIKR